MQQKVNVKFKIGTKLTPYFSDIDLKPGDNVIVESEIGQSYGKVDSITTLKESDDDLKKVIRKADEKDLKKHEQNLDKARQTIIETKNLVEKLKLDMNVVNAEYSFDGSKVIIDFISDERVDFRELVKELVSKLHTRIELRQIGVRDQASMVGGIGICGRVCCCASHLKDFEKVSIKMAKTQGLALNPSKISGACGRLMCCLEYENDYYKEVSSKMPRVGGEVKTPDGTGTVVYQNALTQVISVKVTHDDTTTIKDYKLDDIIILKKDNNPIQQLNKQQVQQKQKKDLNNKEKSNVEQNDKNLIKNTLEEEKGKGLKKQKFNKNKHQNHKNKQNLNNKPNENIENKNQDEHSNGTKNNKNSIKIGR